MKNSALTHSMINQRDIYPMAYPLGSAVQETGESECIS